MKVAQPVTCQIQVAGDWQTVTIAQAHNHHRSEAKRCSACHGPVYVFGTYTSKNRLGLMHRKGHKGCPFSGRGFSGISTPHPDALR
jgi:hypothetical protein